MLSPLIRPSSESARKRNLLIFGGISIVLMLNVLGSLLYTSELERLEAEGIRVPAQILGGKGKGNAIPIRVQFARPGGQPQWETKKISRTAFEDLGSVSFDGHGGKVINIHSSETTVYLDPNNATNWVLEPEVHSERRNRWTGRLLLFFIALPFAALFLLNWRHRALQPPPSLKSTQSQPAHSGPSPSSTVHHESERAPWEN